MMRLPNIIAATIALAAGISILSLAVPATMAAFALLPTAHIWNQILLRQEPPQEDLLKLHDAQQAAIEWLPSGSMYIDRASTETALAKSQPSGTGDRAEWYERAEASVEKGLLRSPANPYAWARLAYLRYKNGGSNSAAHEALIMSFLTGPYERRLAMGRIRYAILLWNQLSPEYQAFVKRQILWADRRGRRALIEMAQRGRKSRAIILSAMARDPNRLVSFTRQLNQ